jgi:putative PIN family toxin of toxin-antitoxin system
MKLVFDTNVLISAFIARGLSHRVLEHCIIRHEVVVSQFILDELHEKLVKKFKYTLEVADEAVNLLRSSIEVVVPVPLSAPVCRDPDDDTILATAAAGGCDRIITGDKDLLVLHSYGAVAIESPAEFAAQEGVT